MIGARLLENTMRIAIEQPIRSMLCVAFLAVANPLSALGADSLEQREALRVHGRSSPLVEKVRAATERYLDINVAIAEGWVRATPCVSGPNSGAMGVHLILPARVGDGVLRADQPEALIYEPLPNGRMRLVGVEFIVIAETWDTQNPAAQPQLDGHLLNLVSAPNRYRLPAFYELHVWAWARNPNGNFADWNSQVSCDWQPAE